MSDKQQNYKPKVMDYLSGLEQYIKQNAKLALAEISFADDYFNKKLNYILIEGETDYKFFVNPKFKKFNNNNYYIKLNRVKGFARNNSTQEKPPKPFVKQMITKIMKAKSLCKTFQNNPLYAIVDRDFDDEYPNAFVITQNIFSNNTHDIETLMMSTDDDIYKKINLSRDVYIKVLYMAYQIGCVKFAIWTSNQYLKYSTKHQFGVYFNQENLDIEKYINFLLARSKNQPQIDCKKIIKQLKKDNKINNNGEFVLTLNEFENNMPQDVWFMINGHDFGDVMQFVLNKKIEYPSEVLLDAYKMDNFKKSNLYKKMQNCNLVKNNV